VWSGGKWRKGGLSVDILVVGRAALLDVKFPLKSETFDSNYESYVKPSTNGFKMVYLRLRIVLRED